MIAFLVLIAATSLSPAERRMNLLGSTRPSECHTTAELRAQAGANQLAVSETTTRADLQALVDAEYPVTKAGTAARLRWCRQ